jgi:hypothetical protein
MDASSPYAAAARTVITATIAHTTRSQPGEPTYRAMSALTRKIPEPIIEPMVIAAESNRFRDLINVRGFFIR